MPLLSKSLRRRPKETSCGRREIRLFIWASIFSAVKTVHVQSSLHSRQRLVPNEGDLLEGDERKAVSLADDADRRAASFVETYRERDIWFGILGMEYVINASATLSLAFKAKVHYVYTAPFIIPFFQSNPWLKYRAINFAEKQHVVRTIQRFAYGRTWFFKRNPVAKISSFFVEMLMNQITSRQRRAWSAEHKKELTKFIAESHAAPSAAAQVKANNTQNLFSWTDSIRANPITTVKNVVDHAFQNGLRGVSGLAEWEVNQACFASIHRARNILPMTSVFPGGVFGEIALYMTRAYLIYFQPTLVSYKAIVPLLLALLCQLELPKIVAAILSPIFRAKRRLGRFLGSLWRKYIGMRHDVAGNIMIEDMMRGAAVVMITLLFQLHGVDMGGLTRRGEVLEAAMVAGEKGWAFSDGLFVGAKDFAQLFSAYFRRYVTVTAEVLLFCKDRETVSDDTQEDLDSFFNGPNPGHAPPGDRLLEWCSAHAGYIKKLGTRSLSMEQKFLQYMVKTLQRQFRAFEEYLSNLMSILYDLVFASLESDTASTVSGSYGIPEYSEQLAALLKRQQQMPSLTRKSEMARGIFRKPWMAYAVRNLAHGYFAAAAALTLLNHLKSASSRYNEVEVAAAHSRGNQWLLSASKQVRAALKGIFGRFLNSQVVLSRSKGLKTRVKVFDFISRCQTPDDPEHASACGRFVTTSIDEEKFVGMSLYVLNLGAAGDPKDLTLTNLLGDAPSFDPTAVFADWYQWMLDRGFSRTRHAGFLKAAEEVNSREKVEQFTKVLAACLQERLRFVRYEPEEHATLRLFDVNGRTAIFRPRSNTEMVEQLKAIKPDFLGAPSVFRVTQLHEGELVFAQAPDRSIQGYLLYADDRRELRELQHDPLAAKELLVSQLIGIKGRLGAEMVATLLMVLHRKATSFHQHSLLTFLNLVTPKMFMDTVAILTDALEIGEGGVTLEQGLYSFPQSFETLKDIFLGSTNTLVTRMHTLDSSDSLSIFIVGILHHAYHKIQKNQTGRTKVLERFQQALLQVVEAEELGALDVTFPECSFLATQNDEGEGVLSLRCAIYKFLKLRSLDIQKGTARDMDARRVNLYVDAAVDYLESLRGATPWKEFLNYEALRGSAAQYADTVGKYTFEELQSELSGDITGDGDVLESVRGLMHPSLGMIVRPGSTEGTAQVVETLVSGMYALGNKARKRVRSALRKIKHKVKTLLAHRNLPGPLRMYNVITGGQFFGALEHAERRAFPESGQVPSDFIKTSDLAAFGRVLVLVERTGFFLENPKAMSSIVSEMRTIPLVTPESEQLYQEIQEKISTMVEADLRAAVGYILTYNVAQGSMGVNVALAMLALKGVKFSTRKITHVEKAGILKVLEPDTLRFILRSLEMPLIFKHMKAIPEAEAMTLFRFRPRGSITFAYPATYRVLPLKETVEVAACLDRLYSTGLLQALARQLQKKDEESGCLALFEAIQATLKADFAMAFKLWSQEPGAYDKRLIASCAVLFVLKELLNSGQRETTVQTLLEKLYFDGTPVLKHVEYVASTRVDVLDRMKQVNRVNPIVAVVNMVAGGGIDSVWTNYTPETGHLHFQSRAAGRIPDEPLYDLFVHITDYLMESSGVRPEFFSLERKMQRVQNSVSVEVACGLRRKGCREFFVGGIVRAVQSYYVEEWFRFLEPIRVVQYGKDFQKSEGGRIIDKMALKHLSTVYEQYDLGDYYTSLRQRSVVPVDDVVKSAVKNVLDQPDRTLSTYGIAAMMLDLSKEVREAKIACYSQSLKEYKEYTQKNRETQEMWKIDCVHQYLIDRGSLGYSAAALNEQEKDAMIEALDNEFKTRAEVLYNALIQAEVDIAKLKKQVWTYITLPHISLRSAVRLNENVRLGHKFITSVRQHVPWEVVASDLATRRANKFLCRESEAGTRHTYSSTERPYLFNPFQFALDLLIFVKTNKAQNLRLPKVLLMERLKVLPQLMFLRKRRPPGEILYAKELQLGRELISHA